MKDDGGPAFPHEPYNADAYRWSDGSPGMTLRDWFAGMALQGVVATAIHQGITLSRDEVAMNAYLLADEMLAARKEGQ